MSPTANTQVSAAYVNLERRLTLLAWINSLLGYDRNEDLLADMASADEGFDSEGRSFLYYQIIGRGGQVEIPKERLAIYDANIFRHLGMLNARRAEPITLRYFQYLALLYVEIYLDRYFTDARKFLRELNDFVSQRNRRKVAGEAPESYFQEEDLRKLALWMATGSGKTLLFHINYWQFLHYSKAPLDNILLITPNEGLTEQHLTELAISGIAALRFESDDAFLSFSSGPVIRVIEITKLSQEKRGSGVTVPVDAFEGNNLIFVDEGHKGAGGEAWRSYRDALGDTGFTFEYSATFGQALSATRNDALTVEYGKNIIFDYSYRYFYADGYGKDFRVLNIRQETTSAKTDLLLLGNLLSFYEQKLYFDRESAHLTKYNIDKPLWVFVGSSVNALYTADGSKRSDILTIVQFLDRVLRNEANWAVAGIAKVLAGKTGVDSHGIDIFADRFAYLKTTRVSANVVYRDILRRVFHTDVGDRLHLNSIQSTDGELGLKAGTANEYFGVIYVGDANAFRKLVESDSSSIPVGDDAMSPSLFAKINSPEAPIDILIGARKFVEGWSSWRVSNMGLLNIGRQEGSLIIQLFGRGVRLKGINNSLKRSAAVDGVHPRFMETIETLDIFALRANYMSVFREQLEREGVDVEGSVPIVLPIAKPKKFFQASLWMPRVEADGAFKTSESLLLQIEPLLIVNIDLSLKVEVLSSNENGGNLTSGISGVTGSLTEESLRLVDWNDLYLHAVDYKASRGFDNLIVRREAVRQVLEATPPVYTLTADASVFRPQAFEDRGRVQEVARAIVCKYIDRFYKQRQERWTSQNLYYRKLEDDDPNFQDYTAKVPRSNKRLLTQLQKLIRDGKRLYREDVAEVPTLYFDRHLYHPLVLKGRNGISFAPPALELSESNFVKDLRDYYATQKDAALAGREVYLLRNLARGKGIRFFETRGFFPDFILWIKDKNGQRIIFIEPHGLIHAGSYIHDEKARLHERLPALAEEIAHRSGVKDVTLDSYIISATPFQELRLRYDDGTWDYQKFRDAHILFPERSKTYDYMAVLFS